MPTAARGAPWRPCHARSPPRRRGRATSCRSPHSSLTRTPEPYSTSSTASSRRRRHSRLAIGRRALEELVEVAAVEHSRAADRRHPGPAGRRSDRSSGGPSAPARRSSDAGRPPCAPCSGGRSCGSRGTPDTDAGVVRFTPPGAEMPERAAQSTKPRTSDAYAATVCSESELSERANESMAPRRRRASSDAAAGWRRSPERSRDGHPVEGIRSRSGRTMTPPLRTTRPSRGPNPCARAWPTPSPPR